MRKREEMITLSLRWSWGEFKTHLWVRNPTMLAPQAGLEPSATVLSPAAHTLPRHNRPRSFPYYPSQGAASLSVMVAAKRSIVPSIAGGLF